MPENDSKLIEDYRRTLILRDKSDDCVYHMCLAVTRFSAFLAARGSTLLKAKPPDCEAWLNDLSTHGDADVTRASKLTRLRSFYKELIHRKIADYDPTGFSKVPCTMTKKPRSIRADKIEDILNRAEEKAKMPGASPLVIRDWTILELFYGSGARRAELAKLDIEHISVEQGDVLLHGKGPKDRFCPVTDVACDAVSFYLKYARPKLEHQDNDKKDPALFLSITGSRLSVSMIKKIVKQASPNLSPHMLRHSYAQHRVDNNEQLEHLQQDLGHADPRSTERYTPDVSFDQMLSEHRRYHPRGPEFVRLNTRPSANHLPPLNGRRGISNIREVQP